MQSDATKSKADPLRVACPKCGGDLQEGHYRIRCQSCDFVLWTTIGSRKFTTSELEELISARAVGPFLDFRSKGGKHFAATIRLTPALKVQFDFGQGTPGSPVTA
jgi:DNA topoisomerase-3